MASYSGLWVVWALAANAGGEGNAMAAHLVSCIDVRDFGAETVRVGDLDGDGQPELLFVQSTYGNRKITCLTATTIHGELLWQVGTASAENGRIYSDLPVQIYDWDDDGHNEVLYVRQAIYAEPIYLGETAITEHAGRYDGEATFVILDGRTGVGKGSLALPAPADDCFLFADLTGRGRRADLVVKDRYWNLWGVSHDGEVLWHWAGSTGHFPAYGDVDGDGRDEIFVGFALLDHDGRVIFSRDPGGAHQDAAYAVRLPDGSWRLLFGNGGIHCLAADGTVLWEHLLAEAQHVVAGTFRPGVPVDLAVVDRGQPSPGGDRAPATLHLYDLDGRELWRRELGEGSWAAAIVAIDWHGGGAPQGILCYGRGPGEPAVFVDGRGETVETLPMAYTPDRSQADRRAHFYAYRADLWGDSRDEVLMFGARGACIWTNPRPLAVPTLYNHTLYPGM